jgi:hypothetical protein
MSYSFNDDHIQLNVQVTDDHTLQIHGKVNNPQLYSKMELLAANPIDRNMSLNGSGLPYPSPMIAFDESPNYEIIESHGEIHVVFTYPNSYYTADAKTKIPPSIFAILKPVNDEILHIRFNLQDLLPLRTLGYRPNRQGPIFYNAKQDLIELQGAEGTARTYAEYKIKYDIA